MSRAVLLSIRPEHVARIRTGEKTFELRRRAPKLHTPYKCYIYETKGKAEIPWIDEDGHVSFQGLGKVIGEFICDFIMTVSFFSSDPTHVREAFTVPKLCLTEEEIIRYLGNGRPGTALHISALKIYKIPVDLSRLPVRGAQPMRAPQSWCYVEEAAGDD